MRTRIGATALLVSIALLAIPLSGTAARSPHEVDPASLSPTLNPLYAPYDCWEAGGGITCHGQVDEAFANEVMDWFTCDGRTIYVSGTGHQEIMRWHDAEGRATKTILTVSFPGDVFTLSPSGEGPWVTLTTRLTKHYEYLEPGVRESRVLRNSGALLIVKSADGVIAREVGWIEFAPGGDDEIVTDYRGRQDLMADFDGFMADVCGALLA